MCNISVLSSVELKDRADHVTNHLRPLGVQATSNLLGTQRARAALNEPHAHWLVFIHPNDHRNQPELERAVARIRSRGGKSLVVAEPSALTRSLHSASMVLNSRRRIDEIIAAVVELIFDVAPFAAVPTGGYTVSPTGVGWFSEYALVTDDEKQSLFGVDVTTGRTSTLLPGLKEPTGLFADRKKILLAEKGADRVCLLNLNAGRVREQSRPARRSFARRNLRAPHAVTQARGRWAIADTDNHRVVVGEGDLFGSVRFAHSIDGFHSPCGVAFFSDHLLVADTFGNRVAVVEPSSGTVVQSLEMHCPLQVAAEGQHFLVTSPEAIAVGRVEVSARGKRRVVLAPATKCGDQYAIRNPWGISVNRNSRVLVADRGRNMLWAATVADVVALSFEGGR